MTVIRRTAALLGATVLAAALGTTPAMAATPGPAPTPAPSASPDSYTSLTSALVNLYAAQSGSTLQSYLSTNQLMVRAAGNAGASDDPAAGAVIGSAQEVGAGAGTTPLQATSVDELNAQLAGAGYTLDLRNYSSMQDLAADVVSKSHTADGAVTLAGAQWVSQLGALRAPALTQPTVAGATMPAIPREALAFGLLLDQSITGTVLNAPDLFAAAASSGVGSDALSKVFSEQMLTAWDKSSTSLTSVLPNKCTGAMLAVMASGDPRSASTYTGCAPACATGGLYLNGQTSSMFGAASNQLSGDTSNQLWSYETLLSAQNWRTQDMLEQNPSLVQGLLSDDGTAGDAQLCGAASQSTKSALSSTLPGIFSTLRPQD